MNNVVFKHKKHKRISPSFVIGAIFAGILLWIVGQAIYGNYLAAKVDALRKSYVATLSENRETFESLEYVEDASIRSEFSDEVADNKNVIFNDDVKVVIKLKGDFYILSDRQKCKVICGLDEQIKEQMRSHYKESDYGKYLYENSVSTAVRAVKYGRYEAMAFYDLDIEYSCKGTAFGIVDGTFCVNPYPDCNKDERLYDYSYYDGEVTEFVQWGTKSSDENASDKQNGKSVKKSGYSDPYNARSYKSAQDFADDKYEEFYDYEDDYDDYDEAYDDAEDYWDDY